MNLGDVNTKTIVISEDFIVEAASNFRDDTKAMIESGIYNFILDFSKCKFIDSTGLGVIVGVYKKCIENNGSVKLKNLNEEVLRVFKLTRLDRVFDIK